MCVPPDRLPFTPPELADETAAQLLDLLYALTTALENYYAAQLLRYEHECEYYTECGEVADDSNADF